MAEGVAGPLCVAPDDVPKWWPFVGERVEDALRRGGASPGTIDDIRRDLDRGLALLWLAVDGGGHIVGTAVTMLVEARSKRCEIVAFAGELERCRSMLPELERYAAAEGCATVRVIGRKGWRRALPGYSEPFVTVDKRL